MWWDLRLALRQLTTRWSLTLSTVLVLAAGLALTSAFAAVVDGVLFKPLPFRDPDRLFLVSAVRSMAAGTEEQPLSMFEVQALEDRTDRFEGVAAVGPGDVQEGSTAEGGDTVQGRQVSPNLFALLGVAPFLGRALTDEDAITVEPRSAVVGYEFWRSRLGADTRVLGNIAEVLGKRFRIVGVMPQGFDFPVGADIWTALTVPRERWLFAYLHCVVRLRAGPAPASVTISADTSDRETDLPLYRLRPLSEFLDPQHSLAIVLLLIGTLLALLVAWIQAAGGQLVSSAEHARANAILMWLGASRARLIRQSLCAGAIVAGLSLALAWTVTPGITALLVSWLPPNATAGHDVRADLRTLALASVASGLGVLLFGLAPVAFLRDEQTHAVATGRRSPLVGSPAMFRTVLLATQVALATGLAYAATVNGRSLLALFATNLGFAPAGLSTIILPQSSGEHADVLNARLQQLRQELVLHPSVAGVASTNWVPFGAGGIHMAIDLPETRERLQVKLVEVSGNFFGIAGTPVLSGRTFIEGDAESRAMIVNERLARLLGGREVIVNATVSLGGIARTVVGVAGDMLDRSPALPSQPTAYLPNDRAVGRILLVRSRTEREARALGGILRPAVEGTNSDTRAPVVTPLVESVERSTALHRARSQLLLLLAGVTLALTGISVHGSICRLIASSLQEIGIRSALGASPSAVVNWLLSRALVPVVAGVVAGVGIGWAVAYSARSLLHNVSPLDWISVGAGVAVFIGIACIAAALPTFKAARGDVLSLLREL